MHHFPQNQERAINLSILIVSGPGKFPRVESNYTYSEQFTVLYGLSMCRIFAIKMGCSYTFPPRRHCFHSGADYILSKDAPTCANYARQHLVCELHP